MVNLQLTGSSSPSTSFTASVVPRTCPTSQTSSSLTNNTSFQESLNQTPLPNSPHSHLAPQSSLPIPDNVRSLLPLLRAQPPYYIRIHIHDRPYLVTVGDVVRLPFRMAGVVPGDILRLNCATIVGSRDFTLKSPEPLRIGRSTKSTQDPEVPKTCTVDGQDVGLIPGALKKQRYIDERLYECRAVVLGTEAEPMRLIEKTKRRQRRVKTIRSKHKYTILKIKELKISNVGTL